MKAEQQEVVIKPVFAVALFWIGAAALLMSAEYLPQEITENTWYEISGKTLINVLVGVWIYADAISRGWTAARVGPYVAFSIVLIEIAVPVYLVKSRGWTGAGRAILRFFLYLLSVLVVFVLVESAAEVLGFAAKT